MKTFKVKDILPVVMSMLICVPFAHSQEYTDYLGAGHAQGITVTTSHNQGISTGMKTISGDGLDAKLMEASRFLAHATFGSGMGEIEYTSAIGFEPWIDEQFNAPTGFLSPLMDSIWADIYQKLIDLGEDPEEIFGPYGLHFNYAWWQTIMTTEDQLRQRMAYALSQILVISMNSDLRDYAEALTFYYDILLEHAFGNYKDLLMDVSLSIPMGFYLSHLNNPREIPEEQIHPDENYAREIMQLFSIGLYELNQDGTLRLDSLGQAIPTYDNNDIKELARVFTGLGPGGIQPWVWWTDQPYFGLDIYAAQRNVPMTMYDEWHDKRQKIILKDLVIPPNQPGMTDIEMAVDYLFNHPNVGPFIGRQLIQRLVKSNPGPGYISRVAAAFNDNGQGVRGDMKAVIKAILLDEEARSCADLEDPDNGRLREPILRITHPARAFGISGSGDNTWNAGFDYVNWLRQHPLASPTVFNFYTPDHSPVGDMSALGLVGPEYKIHDSGTSMNYINLANLWTLYDVMWWNWEDEDTGNSLTRLTTEELEAMAVRPELLINYLDIVLTHGQLTDETRLIIRDMAAGLPWSNVVWHRTRAMLYLHLISPDYTIMK